MVQSVSESSGSESSGSESSGSESSVSESSVSESVHQWGVRVSVESVSAEGFAREGMAVLRDITESARDEVAAAARLIADCVRSDGVIQAFGTGHSQALVLELAGRAGGFVPTNRLSMADL